ncbi:MAG: FtsW/RodA/SpoVE family cell cycle protein [Oscillospiraceae bacterium]|nr:FtsW/RodA/SpoVE family cell cycle protein [Oscillospiraceae bacterium]
MRSILKAVFGYIKRLDKILLCLVLASVFFGATLLYSLYVNSQTQQITNATINTRTIQVQLIAAFVGLGIALILAVIDYRQLVKLWWLYLPATLGLTLLTFTSLGTSGLEGSDDTAWIDLGFMTIQPSEFLKLAFILSFAYHCYKSREIFNNPLNVLALCLHGAVPTVLVMLQGDDGTAIVFLAIFVAIIFAAGLSWKYILGACIIAPIGFILMWNFYLQPVHKNRLLAIIDPATYATKDMLYQTEHSLIALGSGQLSGKGLFGGDYTYVPVCHSDYIFSYAGQVFGFIGCLAILVLLASILLKTLTNGVFARDDLGRYICVGVFAYILSHCIINIGMVIGVTPVIGIPLPFFSQGGSAILTATVSIGLVLSVYYHSPKFDSIFKTNRR